LQARGKHIPRAFILVSLNKSLGSWIVTIDNKCAIGRRSLKNSFFDCMIRRVCTVKIKMSTTQIRYGNRVTGYASKSMLGEKFT
jgi:hypothetical protein